MKKLLLPVFAALFLLCAAEPVAAQGNYMEYYPVSNDPYIRWMSPAGDTEGILFDAKPVVRYSFYNSFLSNLESAEDYASGYFIAFRPQVRMYNDISKPVRTPSYKINIGTQHLFRLNGLQAADREHFLIVAFETGHYSNGQTQCAFSPEFVDEALECKDIYNSLSDDSDLSALLNRNSANFSTNLTELTVKYRHYFFNPYETTPHNYISFKTGSVLYHNRLAGLRDIGGYINDDISLYGRWRHYARLEYSRPFGNKWQNTRISLSGQVQYISGAHAHVHPWRTEFSWVIYPKSSIRIFNRDLRINANRTLGFSISYIHGHDDYNFRFVDSVSQIAVGLKWTSFPVFDMRKVR